MKKIFYYLACAAVLLSFYACPSGFKATLGNPGEEKIERKLLGKWATFHENTAVEACTITQKDENFYNVQVTKKNDLLYGLETENFIGWITKFDGQMFLCLKEESDDSYYHYNITNLTTTGMVSNAVSVNTEAVKDFLTRELLRKEVRLKIKEKEFAEDAVTWTKQ